MKLLITGASSYVGARLYFDLKETYELTGTYFTHPLSSSFVECDLTNEEQVRHLFTTSKPEVIVHVANFPSPRSAVNNEDKFIELNRKATELVVKIANEIGAKVIFISSQAAVHHDNIYGQLKYESEKLMETVKAGYLVIRPSLILGFSPNTQNERPFNRVLKCLDNKTDGAEFDTSWKLQPTYVGHISEVIDKAISQNYWNKTISVYIDELTTQYDIANDILSKYGLTVKPIDQNISIPPSQEDLSHMNNLGVSSISYSDLISKIHQEIENRESIELS